MTYMESQPDLNIKVKRLLMESFYSMKIVSDGNNVAIIFCDNSCINIVNSD